MTLKVEDKTDCPPKKFKIKIPKKRKKRRGLSLLERFKRLRRQVARISRFLQRRLNALAEVLLGLQGVTNALRNDVNVLQAEVSDLTEEEDALRSQLQARIGTIITINTDAGTITGTLTAVGEDFAQILEASGAIVLVRFESINSFI
ncbi:DUF2642 domain-containing protein [Cohnella luojiensis]|uniref:DUF2642 domain-containing protein n=1 Tax=Cohnella luojiensis TaxID=652876 RepID=A0A4Y8M4E0_9BACL|nr:DUF2642 domain-containing protein [Cohnella luojiensis]TFE27185.1 DUF2642 domain-containing protein [Cohnella luojiensis]